MTLAEAREWTDYLIPLADGLGLARHPLPAWAVDPVREAGEAHLALLDVKALLLEEKAKGVAADRRELRRLRSERRRSVSNKRVAINVLTKMVVEAQARAQVPTVADLLQRVGRHG